MKRDGSKYFPKFGGRHSVLANECSCCAVTKKSSLRKKKHRRIERRKEKQKLK